jgi:hypothetical protein
MLSLKYLKLEACAKNTSSLWYYACSSNTQQVCNMKFKTTLALLFLSSSFAANADVDLSEADILGSWKIDAESIHRDASNAKELDTVWTFKNDGTMEGVSSDSQAHARVGEFRATLNYHIENGKMIKQAAPGRSRNETCTAIEKEGSKMVLKCASVYFFMTKK